MVQGLGKEWVFHNIWIKKYPCCFLIHRQIDLLLEFREKHGLSYEDVESIEVNASPGDAACNRPEPKSLGDLQFSFHHILGAAMMDGDVNYRHIDKDILYDSKYQEARSKVKVTNVPELSRYKLFLGASANLTIKMRDGRIFAVKESTLLDPLKNRYRWIA